MAFFTDNFTGTAGDLLTAHTSDSSHTWAKHPLADAGYDGIITDANRVRSHGPPPILRLEDVLHVASVTPPSADYEIEFVVYSPSDGVNDPVKVAVRVHATDMTAYYARVWWNAGLFWDLAKEVAATRTELGSYELVGAAIETNYTGKIQCIGTAIKIFVGGVERIGVTDSAISAAGKIGVAPNARGNTVGVHLDSMVATDLGAGSTVPVKQHSYRRRRVA